MTVKKTLKAVWQFFAEEDAEYLHRSVDPPVYRGFTQDYKSLASDAHKVSGDMHRAWEHTKTHFHKAE